MTRVSSLLNSAPSAFTDDSGQVLAVPPKRRGVSLPRRFRRRKLQPLLPGLPKLLGIATPATHGLRASIKNTLKVSDAGLQVKGPDGHEQADHPKYIRSIQFTVPQHDQVVKHSPAQFSACEETLSHRLDG